MTISNVLEVSLQYLLGNSAFLVKEHYATWSNDSFIIHYFKWFQHPGAPVRLHTATAASRPERRHNDQRQLSIRLQYRHRTTRIFAALALRCLRKSIA